MQRSQFGSLHFTHFLWIKEKPEKQRVHPKALQETQEEGQALHLFVFLFKKY
jgi:hypothetical protein